MSNLLDSIVAGSAKRPEPRYSQPESNAGSGRGLVELRRIRRWCWAATSPNQIGAEVGDSVLVTSPQGELTPLGLAPKYERFRVAGIFHSGFYQYDEAYAFMRLADAQQLFSEPDLLSMISFKVDNLERAPEIAKAIEKAVGRAFRPATGWNRTASFSPRSKKSRW